MKSIIKSKYIALAMAGSLLAVGCTKNFEDINTDHSKYTVGNFEPNYLLTASQLGYTGSTDFSFETWRSNIIYCATMTQGFASLASYFSGDKYFLNEGFASSYWGNTTVGSYVEQVKPITDLLQFTKGKDKYKNLHQVGRIMRVLIMQRITDMYGDVPYTDAGMGFYTGKVTTNYDSQALIYDDFLKELDEAVAALDPAADKITGDAIYGGNIDKWKRFGNSLMLRIAMRLTKVDEQKAKTYATKVQGKTFLDNGDNAAIKGDVAGGRVTINRNSQVLIGDAGEAESYLTKWSKTFIDFLKSNNDPRLAKVSVTSLFLEGSKATPTGTGNADPLVQKGMPNGKDQSGIAGRDISSDPAYTKISDYSSPSLGMIKRDGLTFVLTYAQTELLLAEAATRWGLGNAATHYNNGLKAAITYLGQYDATLAIPDGTANTFATANPLVPATALQQINTQYWALCNTMLDFYETWFNWKRSGFPQLTPVNYPNNATNGQIPRRFPYPILEAVTNPDSYKAASAAVPGGDNLLGRVWWDKQ